MPIWLTDSPPTYEEKKAAATDGFDDALDETQEAATEETPSPISAVSEPEPRARSPPPRCQHSEATQASKPSPRRGAETQKRASRASSAAASGRAAKVRLVRGNAGVS